MCVHLLYYCCCFLAVCSTALHLAASEGRTSCVSYLLSVGANAVALDRWGGTPLHDALRYGHRESADLLQASGAGVADTEYTRLLFDAIKLNKTEVFVMLLVVSMIIFHHMFT